MLIIVNKCDIIKIKICWMGLVARHIQEEQGEKRPLAKKLCKKCKIGENR